MIRLSDFLTMVAICAIWAINAVFSRYVIAIAAVPPLFLSVARFSLAALVLAPMLRPVPRPTLPVVAAGLLMGAGHFGLLLVGYGLIDASLAAILLQTGVPVTAVFSALIIGERVGLPRIAGIALALSGVVLVLWRPGQFTVSVGVLLVILAAASLALGSILLKRLPDMTPLRMQAWTSATSIPPLGIASYLLETGQMQKVATHGLAFAGLLGFSALVVTVISHTAYYRLLRLYDASAISSLTLMFPLMTVALGMAMLGERPGAAFFIGTAIALLGVIVVLRNPERIVAQPRD
jgi:drug/metabolite transporter (DMT)-like permease